MVRMRNKLRIQLLLAAAAVQVTNVPGAFAQAASSQEYNLPADDLGSTLRAVSRLSGREIIFDTDAVAGKRSPRLQGRFNADDAVKTLLRGSGLFPEYRKDVILIRGRTETSGLASDPANVVELFVTGSRIRGGASVCTGDNLCLREIVSARCVWPSARACWPSRSRADSAGRSRLRHSRTMPDTVRAWHSSSCRRRSRC